MYYNAMIHSLAIVLPETSVHYIKSRTDRNYEDGMFAYILLNYTFTPLHSAYILLKSLTAPYVTIGPAAAERCNILHNVSVYVKNIMHVEPIKRINQLSE